MPGFDRENESSPEGTNDSGGKINHPDRTNLDASALWVGQTAIDNRLELLEDDVDMSKVITPHFEELMERFIASGRFNNKSEVIRAGLRLLEDHETNTRRASREDLSHVIETALRDPRPLIPAAKLLRRRGRK